MKLSKTVSGFLMVFVAAAVGFALMYLPGWIISNYKIVSALPGGNIWGALYLGVVIIGGVLMLGSTIWLVWKLWGASLSKKIKSARRNKNPSELSMGQREFEINENIDQIESLKSQVNDGSLSEAIDPMVRELEEKREAQTLEIVAFGTISSGKSSVLNLLAGREVFQTGAAGGTTVTRNEIPWPGIDKVTLVDTPGLGEIDGEKHVHISAESAKDADLVLVIVDGPLRESEHTLLERLGQMEKRTIICLNKADWFSENDRTELMGQIGRQTNGFVARDDIVAIQAQSGYRTRRVIKADGTEVDQEVEIPPFIDPLADRMVEIVRKDGKDLLMANLLLQSRGMVEKAKKNVRDKLDDKAWDIVDKYMWGAGGVAAVNPFPLVDLAAGTAISTKMILDLAEVYQQKVDLETASMWLTQMGKNLLGFLGATGAAVAVTSVLASLIKSVPFAGTLAGGLLQGTVQALITRWIGAVFIEYFRNEMQTPEGGLAGLARRQWEKVTTTEEIRKLLKTAREKLAAKS